MTTHDLIKQHERAIDLLETIRYAEKRRATTNESLQQFGYQFPRLRDKYSHEIEITGKAIERLWERYHKLLHTMK